MGFATYLVVALGKVGLTACACLLATAGHNIASHLLSMRAKVQPDAAAASLVQPQAVCASGLGSWYPGKVKRTIHRAPGDDLYGSPWDSVEVEWESVASGPAETSCVCPWELEPRATQRWDAACHPLLDCTFVCRAAGILDKGVSSYEVS